MNYHCKWIRHFIRTNITFLLKHLHREYQIFFILNLKSAQYHLVLRIIFNCCSLLSNILFTLFSFYSQFLIHLALSNFLLNFSTIIFYKSSPLANLHINTLDSFINSYFITYWFIFNGDDSSIWKISWLFYHMLSIFSWMSLTRYD